MGRLAQIGLVGEIASLALRVVGPAAVPVLLTALTSDDDHLRGTAALTLGYLGTQAQEAVPALMTALQGAQGWARESILEALRRTDPQGRYRDDS